MILLTRKKLDAQAAKSDDYKLEKRVRSKQPSNSWLVDEMMRMKEEEEEEEEEEESSKQASKQQNAPAHVAYPFRSLHSSKQSSIVEHVEEEERAKAPLTTTQESSRPVKWQSLANANANHYEQLTEEWSDMPSAEQWDTTILHEKTKELQHYVFTQILRCSHAIFDCVSLKAEVWTYPDSSGPVDQSGAKV
ncbi:hypothetical protein T4C_11646 [Trichinella pseudospiralis]|uniref:Uncharacterized protein n=1 Tax=Trichinella pseudospiralis TaxID=6337 RepID=A0A0V1J3U7_TRIPS|nr:hypothetical protein T4C_11646 [Trichinella pseudospiralis]